MVMSSTVFRPHRGEAEVVVRRRDEPAAAGEEHALPVPALRGIVDECQAVVALPLVVGGEPLRPVFGDDEGGIGHAERLEHVLLEIRVQPLSGDQLDQMSADVGRYRVVPARARRELQR
jgi:hypothetical protein